MPKKSKADLMQEDIFNLLEDAREQKKERGELYETYGSACMDFIDPLIELAEAARYDYPEETLALLRAL